MSLRNSVISYIIHVSVFSPTQNLNRILVAFMYSSLLTKHSDKITQACGKNFLIFNFFYFYREVYFSSPYTILKLVLLYLVGYIIVKKCNLEREKQNQFSGDSLKGGLFVERRIFFLKFTITDFWNFSRYLEHSTNTTATSIIFCAFSAN